MNYTKTLLGTLGYIICLSTVVYVGSLGILTFASDVKGVTKKFLLPHVAPVFNWGNFF